MVEQRAKTFKSISSFEQWNNNTIPRVNIVSLQVVEVKRLRVPFGGNIKEIPEHKVFVVYRDL